MTIFTLEREREDPVASQSMQFDTSTDSIGTKGLEDSWRVCGLQFTWEG